MHDAGAAQPLTTSHMSTSECSAHNANPPDDDPITADMKPPAVEQPRPLNGFRQNNFHVHMPTKQNITLDVTANSPLVETPTSVVPQSPFASHTSAFPPSFSLLIKPRSAQSHQEESQLRRLSQSTQVLPTCDRDDNDQQSSNATRGVQTSRRIKRRVNARQRYCGHAEEGRG